MTIQQHFNEARKLSIEERLELAHLLWESTIEDKDGQEMELSKERKEMLRQRAKQVANGKMKTHSWEELEQFIGQYKS